MAQRWIDVGDVGTVDADLPFETQVEGTPIVIARCEDGYRAVEDRCTHDGEPLGAGEVDAHACEIVCPRHGARFCLRTGEALSPPAYEPVQTFAVRIEGGRVLVAVA